MLGTPMSPIRPCMLGTPMSPISISMPGLDLRLQNWTGDDDEDFEQSCRPSSPGGGAGGNGDDQPGRAAFAACNYTCQYLLAGLEPGRFQVQILHEYDTCCFSPHNRHDGMLQYESNIRNELMAADRTTDSKHGWFTTAAVNHSK